MQDMNELIIYWYIPFIFLPYLLGYIINHMSSKDNTKIKLKHILIFTLLPIFNLSTTIVLFIIFIMGCYSWVELQLSKSSKFEKIANKFENN